MKINKWLAVTSVAAAMCLGAAQGLAQDNGGGGGGNGGGGGGGGGRRGGFGGGNFDPAQMQQRRMDRIHEQLEVKDDAEWSALEPLVKKVMDAQQAAFADMARGRFGRGGRGGGQNGGGDNNQGNQGGQGGGRGGMFGQPSPEQDDLQKAVDAKASNSEMKSALAKYAAARKTKQADLEKAQAELRKVLSVRQEAIATLNGLL